MTQPRGVQVNLLMRSFALIVSFWLLASGCSDSNRDLVPDRTVVASSQYPPAIDAGKVGSYPALTKSGAGYFYDDVLEYRVWIHPKGGGDNYYRAFASYEPALQFSKSTTGAEEPLVLVHQKKWVNEPEPGKFEPRSDERITEWQTVWLSQNTKRTEDSIDRFLKEKTAGAK
jgi:putative acetyltransferase